MKSIKRIHPVALFVLAHAVALGVAIFTADWVAQAYADQASDHSSHMQLFPLNDGTYQPNY